MSFPHAMRTLAPCDFMTVNNASLPSLVPKFLGYSVEPDCGSAAASTVVAFGCQERGCD